MGFDVTPTIEQDWTNNLDALETGINRLRPGGGTALFDAVYTACRDKLLDVSRGQEPVRKAMILISDGDDNQSRVHPDEAIKDVPARRNHHLCHQHQLDPSRGKGRQGV
jgi:Ca-activated chloride channel homolog